MAGNRQEFTYAINADTSKAKKQIADLFKSLDKVQKYSLDNFNIAPDLIKASHAAEELAGHLRMATNVNTGQLDLAKFNQSIRNSNTSLTELISSLGQGGSAGQAAFEQMTAAIARTQVPLRQTSALLRDMATTLKNTVKWELSSAAVHGLESALSGAVSYAKNLNTSLTNIRIVTGQSVEDMARFTKEANAAAKALSTTTKSYTDASLIYYQQGDSQEMAAKKAAITIKAANASFETSAKEMSEYLTSVWNSYQVGADELERYVDIMANLGAKTATSLEEIATSMQKVAATSNTVGVSMEQVSSIIATVSSVTRESAESIGTSYKTIFARIGDLKLGKADEDGIGLGQVSSQLDAIGVKILDESGNLREMGDIIMDLGTKWQTMNQAQKTAVAQVVAGKRQYTQLMALFENWDMFQANLNLAENSEGALQDMADIYAESWEAASARVQASMEGIFNSIINDQGLIKLTNFTADFVNGIGSAIDSIGGLNGVLRLTGSILMKTFSKEAGARIKDLGRSVVGMFQDPKKNYQQASQQMREQLADINNKKQVDAQIQLIDAKNQLLQVEEYLSATQKQVAQAGIADIENQVNKVKELEDAYIDLRNDVANVNLNRLGASRDSFGNATFEEEFKRLIENQYKDIYSNITSDTSLQGAYDALLKNSQMAGMGNQGLAAISPENLAQYDNLEQRMSVVRQEAEGLRSMMEELGITIQGMPIERLNQMLEKTDWNDEDIQALRNALEQLERTGVENCANLERVINKFLEEASQAGFAAEDIERLRQAFERVSAAGDDLANAQRKVAAASESLSQKTDKLNHALDRQSMSFEKAIESALDLGSGALDLINGFSAMSDVTAQWGDESLSLADKLGSLLSTVLSLGMAIPSLAKGLTALGVASGPAGWIALAAAAGMGALGVASGNYEADKKEYQDKQNKTDKNRQEEVQKTDEELSNIQTLMKNYNTLRETYISTGEGQDALAASARALAEAYGLVGANLLIAEGNFSAFEQMIASSTGLDKVSNFYEEQLRAGRQELADVGNMKSKYYDQSNLDFAADYDVGQYKYSRPEASRQQLEAMAASNANLIEDYYLDTIEAARQDLIDGGEKTAQYNAFKNKVSQAEKGQIPIGGFKSGLDLGFFEDLPWDQTITLPENYQEILMDNLYKYFDADIFELFQGDYEGNEAPSHILDKFEQLLKTDDSGNYTILESDLANIQQQTQDLKIQWLKDFVAWGNNELKLMTETFTIDEELLAKNYDDALAERERAQQAAIQGQRDADIAAAQEAYGKVASEINYFDVLTNEEGWLSYNDEGTDKFEWLKTFEKQKKAAQEEYDKIEAELNSGNVEKGSYLETLLTNRLETLKMMLSDFKQMSDADLSTLIEQMTGYENAAEKVRMITEVMSKMIGKSEANTSFTDFNSYMNNIQAGIDASAKEYEQLQTYLQTNENGEFLLGQDGAYLIKEGFEEKYQAARDAIAAGYISDFTAFDDYLTIYQNIAAVFSGADFTKAMSYIDAQEIKNSREVNSRLLNAMQRDIQNGEMGVAADDVLAYNRQTLAGEKAIADYQTMSSLASSYKEDLNLTDAQGLLSILQQELDDGTNAWNDFIQMDFDQRQAYLQAREESALRAAQEAQKQIAEEAIEKQKSLYYSEETYNRDKIGLQTFLDTHTKQADGTYTNNQTGNVVDSITAQHWNNVSTRIADYDQYGLDAENALSVADAIELILTQTAGLSEQMQTLVADFEQFNKTGRVSADVMKKMAEWGIDGSKIKTAQDYLKVMKSIYTQAKTNASTAEQNYLAMVGDNEYDWSNEQVQKDHAKEYAAWQEMMRLKQIEYDTEEQYNTTRQGYLDSELAKHQQILSQMRERKSLAEEEANKTQQLAEAMSAAIQTGNLSESARVGMDPELLNTWDSAANATERGAIAAQAWNKYATQISTAGEELSALYDTASTSLDHIIAAGKRQGKTDILNFNFADAVNGKNDFVDYIASRVKDPAAQAVWNEGFESLISHTDISNMSDLDILTAVKDEIIKAGNITEEEFNRILAGVRDNIASTFEQLAQQNIDAAQKAADAWLTAFNTIKNARQTLLSGGNILDQIAGDPDAIFDLMQSTGKGAQELYDMILKNDKEGLLTATSDYMNSGDYLKNLMGSKGYVTSDFGQKNRLRDIHSLGYSVKNGKWVDSTGAETDVAKIQENLAQHYAKLLQSTEKLDPESALAKARQLATGEIDYADLSQEAKMFADALGISTEALKEQAKQQELAADVEYKGNASNLTKEQIEAEGALVNGQVGTYDEYQKLATAIANAQEAKYNGETWDSLAQEDRDLLDKYNIDFNNVDTAAADCASALAACANAAYQLALAAAKEQGYDYDSSTGTYTKDGNEVTAKNDPIVQELEASRTGAEKATANISDVSSNTYAQMAKSVGMTTEQLESYCERMIEAGKITETTKDAQMDVARSLARTSRGFDKVEKSLDDYMTTLQKTNKTSAKYEDTLDDLRDMYGDVLDLSADLEKDLPDAFLESEENARLLKIAMEDAGEAGDKAYDQLQANAAKSILLAKNVEISPEFENALYTMASQVDQFEVGKPITLGEATRISPDFGAALNTLVSQAAMAGDQAASIIQSAAEAMGFDAEVETKTFPVTGSAIEYQQGATIFDPASNTTYVSVTPNVTEDTGEVTAVALKTITPKGVSGGGIRSGSGGGGGSGGSGGGGSKKKEKKEHKRYRDEIERYHKTNETLSRISEELDKIDKFKERAYGAKHLKAIDAETAALKEQIDAQQALYNEAMKYAASDQLEVAKYGAEFDEDGTITNYDEVVKRIVDEYNAAVDTYNNSAQEDGDKELLEAAEQRFDDAMEAITNYEEAIATANQAMNDLLDAQNQISELETEKITYLLEYKIDMNERDLERLEYFQEKYADDLEHQDEAYAATFDTMLEYEDNLAAISEAMAELDRKKRDGLINDEDYAEAMQDFYDQIYDNLSNLNEIQEQLVDTYANTLSLAREEIEKTTDAIDSANSTLQSYIDIIALAGGETDYEKMGFFYEQMNENNLTKINVQKAHLDALLEEEDKYQEKIRSGQQLTDLEKQQYQALQEEIQDARDTLMSSTTEALEMVRTTYENTINKIGKDFEEFMVGAGDSIAHLQEQYGYFQEEQERYVSTAKELYEVSKLNRDIEGTLSTTTSSAAKEALKALQEKINKQSELNQLTEYDIEMNQLQYQLLLARIKLEESQNAKDTVRLTRDEDGNYAYRYTANQDKIDEAAQNYEDILQQINDTTAQRTSEIENQMLETMAWAKEQMAAIATDYTLTEEEKRDRLEELNNQFAAKMQYLQEQNGIATENLMENQTAIAEHYGTSLSSITASAAGNVNTQVQSMIDETQKYVQAMNEALFGESGVDQNWKDYLKDIGIITSNAGTAYGEMVEGAEEMGEMTAWSAEQAQETIQTLTDTLEPLEALTAAWNAHNSILESTISDYETLADIIQSTLTALGGIANGGAPEGGTKAGTAVSAAEEATEEAMDGLVDQYQQVTVQYSAMVQENMDAVHQMQESYMQSMMEQNAVASEEYQAVLGLIQGTVVDISDVNFETMNSMQEQIEIYNEMAEKYNAKNHDLLERLEMAIEQMANQMMTAYISSVSLASPIDNMMDHYNQTLEQMVNINADFPNASNVEEIREALLSLTNYATQFANRKNS